MKHAAFRTAALSNRSYASSVGAAKNKSDVGVGSSNPSRSCAARAIQTALGELEAASEITEHYNEMRLAT